MDKDKHRTLLVWGLLSAGTLAVFWPVRHYDFIVFDDGTYVVGNLMVRRGLTWAGTAWAFTTFHGANWHPLTWLSHMLDCQLYGLNAGGHHLTSLLLHSANAGLLFVALKRLTGAHWRSALVAALFALHPLHVESFAWIAERKDVLSALFFMLTLWAYAENAECRSPRAVGGGRKSEGRRGKAEGGTEEMRSADPPTTPHAPRSTLHASTFYFLSLFFFACGLMSKPMLVTVPFVLLLLDYWPLGRMQNAKAGDTLYAPRSTLHVSRAALLRLIWEKSPFFALSAASCVVTCLAQSSGGAVDTLARVPVAARLANALVAWLGYLEKMVWPANLSILYLRPPHWPVWRVGLAVLVLAGISLLVLVLSLVRTRSTASLPSPKAEAEAGATRNHSIGSGLPPHPGPLPKGEGRGEGEQSSQLHRYGSTLPSARTGTMSPGGGTDPSPLQKGRGGIPGSGVVSPWTGWLLVGWLWFLGMLVPVSGFMQVGNQYMADRYSYLPLIGLFIIVAWGGWEVATCVVGDRLRHPDPWKLVPDCINAQYAKKRQRTGAVQDASRGSWLRPAWRSFWTAPVLWRFLIAFHCKQAPDESAGGPAPANPQPTPIQARGSGVLRLVAAAVLIVLGGLAVRQVGYWQNSETIFNHCLAVSPDNHVAHNNLGAALAQQGRTAEARAHFLAAWHLQPHDADTLCNVGVVLADEGKFEEAAPYLREAVGVKPELGTIYGKLGLMLDARGSTAQAIACYREGLRVRPGQVDAANNLAWILATTPDDKLRDGSEAVQLAQQACEASGYKQALVVGTLAAAYAEAGRFPQAVATAEQAIALATAASQPGLADRNRQLLQLYRAGKPFREKRQDNSTTDGHR